ncbi:hypothetical protein ANME2D_01982 [Candidatus Methanoperedens nitroreducens]|uniref:Uncharacterized protein n=1 Tax=Candidatus Methanoperedens nitratireducens TaxID=1392998 RepID=A0A062UYD4_9EURY|nr:hypothetical protein [Candidatus Methanoperedens nitroreducens]KCZ71926.1 hypothetical protein ANME2D_01982 [Candidatus Methanoperedens nitroreducens]MDJ1422099.1 hypothetical protein [Candidatus Methanoperedens sp.]
MDVLEDFEEIAADKQHAEIKISVMHVELSIKVRYFISQSGIGYCVLLIDGVKGKGLRGKVESAATKVYVGRAVLIFLSLLDDGKKLITVPALFEKEPTFSENVDLSNFIINAYFPDNLKKTTEEVYNEHLNFLKDKKISNNTDNLYKSILELPGEGLEILRSYR